MNDRSGKESGGVIAAKARGGSPAERPPAGAVVEFRLDDVRCCIVIENARDSGGDGAGEGLRKVQRFQIGGCRYALCVEDPRTESELPTDPLMSMTPREQQIVRLVCQGCVNKQIAYRLRISEYTVKTYLKQIFVKLGVHSRSAMVFKCAAWVGAHNRLDDDRHRP